MAYSNNPLQHINADGGIDSQVVAPPDFPGDKNPPMNCIATSRYTTRCSHCGEVISAGTPYHARCFLASYDPGLETNQPFVRHVYDKAVDALGMVLGR